MVVFLMQFQWIILVSLRKSLFKKLSAFKVIYFLCNSEENESHFSYLLHASKKF